MTINFYDLVVSILFLYILVHYRNKQLIHFDSFLQYLFMFSSIPDFEVYHDVLKDFPLHDVSTSGDSITNPLCTDLLKQHSILLKNRLPNQRNQCFLWQRDVDLNVTGKSLKMIHQQYLYLPTGKLLYVNFFKRLGWAGDWNIYRIAAWIENLWGYWRPEVLLILTAM